MKLSLSFLSALLLAAPAFAASAWAPGVSIDGGWVDYNKAASEDSVWGDTSMCWAASASNVISWWVEHNESLLTSTTLPTANPWEVARYLFTNDGGTPTTMFNWWINGVDWTDTLPGYFDENVYNQKEESIYGIAKGSIFEGGFLKQVYSTTSSAIVIRSGNSNSYDFARSIVEALESGYALSISVSDSALHAFTLWGVEYIETDKGIVLTRAWITDSDDASRTSNQPFLISADIAFKADEDVAENNSIALINLPGLTDQSYRIDTLAGMRTDPAAVPEPATATLGLVALAGLAMRRRRK